jgi:hypothetical protein
VTRDHGAGPRHAVNAHPAITTPSASGVANGDLLPDAHQADLSAARDRYDEANRDRA